jgi:hypothetical protein
MNIKFLKYIIAPMFFLLCAGEASAQADRTTVTATVGQRGTSVLIPYATVVSLCADIDGCQIRMAMYNWDGTGRTASRSSLFYYNSSNGRWRAERDDRAGTVGNEATEHVMSAWACYLTDGNYSNWTNHGDLNQGFSVLSWNQYVATCRVTLID